ncbi:unnamed protein product [Medioppia subpectinata]|uniref:Uncharacterized protein n=1 Tax=Medioppia subpectinata TaxID=1979941 RepID=A0A7R9LL31_9ACAR|nr:unnamed protein product [Medioppia subpectinata]CAG2119753.1 unnamed protein product [Medioppia subpectinata]
MDIFAEIDDKFELMIKMATIPMAVINYGSLIVAAMGLIVMTSALGYALIDDKTEITVDEKDKKQEINGNINTTKEEEKKSESGNRQKKKIKANAFVDKRDIKDKQEINGNLRNKSIDRHKTEAIDNHSVSQTLRSDQTVGNNNNLNNHNNDYNTTNFAISQPNNSIGANNTILTNDSPIKGTRNTDIFIPFNTTPEPTPVTTPGSVE